MRERAFVIARNCMGLRPKHDMRMIASIPCSSIDVMREGCSSGSVLVTVVTTPSSAVEVMVVDNSVDSSTPVEVMVVVGIPCSSVVVISTGGFVGSSTPVEVMVVGTPASSVEVKVTAGSSTLVVGSTPGNTVEVVKTLRITRSAR